jgi:hypothetical protein
MWVCGKAVSLVCGFQHQVTKNPAEAGSRLAVHQKVNHAHLVACLGTKAVGDSTDCILTLLTARLTCLLIYISVVGRPSAHSPEISASCRRRPFLVYMSSVLLGTSSRSRFARSNTRDSSQSTTSTSIPQNTIGQEPSVLSCPRHVPPPDTVPSAAS